jgi:hypothetical protein
MTLIEILMEYKRLLQEYDRRHADAWLKNNADRSLWWDVSHTFNDDGDFIDATGNYFQV